MTRKLRLVDCNPRWLDAHGIPDAGGCYVQFDCPEGHRECSHTVPFTPSLLGKKVTHPNPWERTGDTFETLTLRPSIRRIRRYENRESAIAAGCLPEYLTDSMFCALHVFIVDGKIEFCGDST